MGEANLLQHLKVIALSLSHRGGGPFPHAVDGDDGRLGERGGEERAGRVGLMMFGEQDRGPGRQAGQGIPDRLPEIQLLFQPAGQDLGEGRQAGGSHREVGLQHSREFGDGLVVEDHGFQPRRVHPALAQAELHGLRGESLIVLDPGEPLLLGSSRDASVRDQGRRGIVVEGRQPQDGAHACGRLHRVT